jgi:uncharacterized protein (DUF2236 family)
MRRPASGAMHDRHTLSWQLNSRWFVLIGGARAAIMQVADPRVAAGVAQFSSYRTDPLGRLERTMDAMLTIGFGMPARREQVLADLREVHGRVRGRTSDGAPYSALDPQLMYWVLATLVDTVMVVERRYVGRMRHADRERYVDESRALADAFGIPERFVPQDLAAFRAYMAERVAAIEPDDDSREVTRTLLQPGLPVVPDLAFAPLDWITTELLPATIRHRLGLSDLHPAQLAVVRSAQAMSRVTLPLLPPQLSVSPFAQRALAGAR